MLEHSDFVRFPRLGKQIGDRPLRLATSEPSPPPQGGFIMPGQPGWIASGTTHASSRKRTLNQLERIKGSAGGP